MTALGFACYSCNTVGKADIETASDAIVKHLFSGHDLKYDHNTAEASYTKEASDKRTGLFLYNQFDLTDYMFVNNQKTYLTTNLGAKGPSGFVNCKDQACAVTSLVNLLKGGSATYRNHNRFGYIKAAEHVGGVNANNPLFWNLGNNKEKLLGAGSAYLTDLTWADPKIDNQRRRSFFNLHAYSLINKKVVDATIGPTLTSESKNIADYLIKVRDTSTNEEKEVPYERNNMIMLPIGASSTAQKVHFKQK